LIVLSSDRYRENRNLETILAEVTALRYSVRTLIGRVVYAGIALTFLTGCGLSSAQSSTINGTPVPTSTPVPSYIFQDSLSSNSNNWIDDSNCFFKSGSYHIASGYICYAPTNDVADAVGKVTVQQLSGDNTTGYGIVFRRPSQGNYYQFLIDSNGKWAFLKTVSGNTTTLADFQANSAIKSGLNTSNTIAVKAVGSNYTFFVNDVQVGQFSDTTFTAAGSWGLTGSDGLEVVYTNFSLAKP
jgi:hypothetical protein